MRIHRHAHGAHGDANGAGDQVFRGRATRYYNFMANRVLRRLYRRLAQDIVELAPDGGTVLDIGTGPGVLLVELARLRPDLRLTGVDPSPDMVAAAERNFLPIAGRPTAEVGDSTRLPYADGSFDLIVSSLSLHHWDDPEAAVPELARVLRLGGRVCIYDFRSAPFGRLLSAARTQSVLIGQPPQQTSVSTGIPLMRPLTRVIMAA